MLNRLKQLLNKIRFPHSLKNRLILVLLLSSIIPLVLIGSISLYSINYLMKNKVENGIQSNLSQVRSNVENVLDNLDYASRQLAYDGKVASKFESFIEGKDEYIRYVLSNDIKESISLISNTNPNIGVVFYYSEKNGEVVFPNYPIKKDFSISKLPIVSDKNINSYFWLYDSASSLVNGRVISIVRKMDWYSINNSYIYIETNEKVLKDILNPGQYPVRACHILTDSSGTIVFSGDKDNFPENTKLQLNTNGELQKINGNYMFIEKCKQGFNIIASVDKNNYDQAASQWLLRFILVSAVSLILSFLFALVVWNMIYRPLKNLKKEIMLMSENKFDSKIRQTDILEFNELLEKFRHMRQNVVDLLIEIEHKERMKRKLEVEKLMYQINPHFLHNTLNSVQWLARMNGQTEIGRLIALLTKVLHYNLGKEGSIVTVREEIDALQTYVELQKIRYDYQFDVKINVDEHVLEAKVPRFIMQPLVENALYHGLDDKDGFVSVDVLYWGEKVRICVEDNGLGMSKGEIKKILDGNSKESQKSGLGIGISYVNKMIWVYYGDKAKIDVESKIGEGTKFIITIPFIK